MADATIDLEKASGLGYTRCSCFRRESNRSSLHQCNVRAALTENLFLSRLDDSSRSNRSYSRQLTYSRDLLKSSSVFVKVADLPFL